MIHMYFQTQTLSEWTNNISYSSYINFIDLDIKHVLLHASLSHLAFEIYCCLLRTWHAKLHQSEAWHDLADVQQCRILYHTQSTYTGGFHCEYSCDLGIQLQWRTSWNRFYSQTAQVLHPALECAPQYEPCSSLPLWMSWSSSYSDEMICLFSQVELLRKNWW